MTYPFVYKVHIVFDNDEYHVEHGIGFANSFAEAATKIEDYYGGDLIAIQHIELLEENPLLPCVKQVFDTVRSSDYAEALLKSNGYGEIIHESN